MVDLGAMVLRMPSEFIGEGWLTWGPMVLRMPLAHAMDVQAY